MRRLTKCFKCTTVILYIGFLKKNQMFLYRIERRRYRWSQSLPRLWKGKGWTEKKSWEKRGSWWAFLLPRNNNGCVIIARSFFSAADYLGDWCRKGNPRLLLHLQNRKGCWLLGELKRISLLYCCCCCECNFWRTTKEHFIPQQGYQFSGPAYPYFMSRAKMSRILIRSYLECGKPKVLGHS